MATPTVSKLTTAPKFPVTETLTSVPTLTWTAPSSWKRFESATITLQGGVESVKTAIKDWHTKNEAAIKANGVVPQFQISSWTIVVDITSKVPFNNVRNVDPANDANVPNVSSDANYQPIGAIGDAIGLLINVKEQPYQ